MARTFANILTAIWDDPDFIALPGRQQRTYFLLFTQADISAAGTLPLTLKRLAKLASDTTRVELNADVTGLQNAGFVFVDDDEEELLVRTFVKHDNGYGNSKRRYAIRDAAMALRSPFLRRVLWKEFEKLGIADLLPPVDVYAGEEASEAISDATPEAPFDALPMALSENLDSRRDVVTVRTTDPHSTNRTPHTDVGALGEKPPPARGRPREEPPPNAGPPGQAEQILTEWRTSLKKRPQGDIVVKVGGFVHGALGEGQDPADVREALRRWQAKGDLGPGVLPSILHEVANRPAPSTALTLPNGRASPAKPSTTDQRVAEALALASRLESQGGFP